MGQSKLNKQMRQDQLKAQQERNELMKQAREPSAAEARFTKQSAAWDTWVAGKNYGKPPEGSILNFDLYTPAMQAKQREKYSNLQGVGGAALGGTQGGKDGIAVEMARERNINEAAQTNAAQYEGAVKEQDNYFKGAGFQWAGMQQNRNMGLLGSAQNQEQYYGTQYANSYTNWMPALVGGAISAGAGILSGGLSAGGFLNRPR
jgi:hypothetical protein